MTLHWLISALWCCIDQCFVVLHWSVLCDAALITVLHDIALIDQCFVMLHWSVLCDVALITVLHDIALIDQCFVMLHWSVLCGVALISTLWCCIDQCFVMLHWSQFFMTLHWLISALWCCIDQCFVMLHWSQFFMMLQIWGSHWRIHQVVCWILCGYLCAWNRWQTPREHHGHWGRTGGLSVMTDTQRTWVLRTDSGLSVMTDTQRTWSLRMDMWAECHDWYTENMVTEDRQVGWVPQQTPRVPWHTPRVSWQTPRELHSHCESKSMTATKHVKRETQRTAWLPWKYRWLESHVSGPVTDTHEGVKVTWEGQLAWVSCWVSNRYPVVIEEHGLSVNLTDTLLNWGGTVISVCDSHLVVTEEDLFSVAVTVTLWSLKMVGYQCLWQSPCCRWGGWVISGCESPCGHWRWWVISVCDGHPVVAEEVRLSVALTVTLRSLRRGGLSVAVTVTLLSLGRLGYQWL